MNEIAGILDHIVIEAPKLETTSTQKEKGQSRHDSVLFLRLPTMPLFSWGIFSSIFCWKPAEKMHAHQRSLRCFLYYSTFMPEWHKFSFYNNCSMLNLNLRGGRFSRPAVGVKILSH
jgi:hypothetical protein